MLFSEQLYLAGLDVADAPWIEPLLTRFELTVAADPVNSDIYTVPGDRVLLLTNAAGRVAAGGAQTASRLILSAVPPSASDLIYFLNEDFAAVNLRSFNWQGYALVPGNWVIRAQGDFSAGVAANTVDCALFGVLMPRGNITRLG